MNKKLIFGSDYDGTYRRSGDSPAKSDIEVVRRFRKAGNLFGVVTGRDVYEAMAIEGQFEDEYDFILCSTGAACFFKDAVSGEGEPQFLWREYCDGRLMRPLYELCMSFDATHIHSDIIGIAGGPQVIHDNAGNLDPDVEIGCSLLYWDGEFHPGLVGGHILESVEGFTQFTVYFPDSEIAAAAGRAICETFPGEFTCHSLGNGFDITRADIGKASGLCRLAAHLDVDEDSIWVAGDGYNDIGMLSSFNGVAMSGSADEVMAVAKYEAENVATAIEIAMRNK